MVKVNSRKKTKAGQFPLRFVFIIKNVLTTIFERERKKSSFSKDQIVLLFFWYGDATAME